MINYKPIQKTEKGQQISMSKGLDTVNSPLDIAPGKVSVAKNIVFTDKGWTRRDGITSCGASGSSKVNGLGAIKKDSGDILLRAYGTKLQKLVTGTWTDVAAVTLSNILTQIVSYTSTDLTTAALTTGTATTDSTTRTLVKAAGAMTINAYSGKVVRITSGTGTGIEKLITSNDLTTLFIEGVFDTVPDGTSVFDIREVSPGVIITNGTDTPIKYDGSTVTTLTGMPKFYSLEVAHDRLFGSRRDSDNIYFSNVLTTYFPKDNYLPIDPSGDSITRILNNQQEVIIYKENSRFRLLGYDETQFQLIEADSRIGAVAGMSVAHGNNYSFFLGYGGVYSINSLENSSTDEGIPISKDINNLILAHSASEIQNAVGWVYDNKYFVSIGSGVFVYDIYQTLIKKTHVWTIFNFPEGIVSAFVQNGIAYLGSVTQTYTIGGTTDAGTAITIEVVTGNIAYGDDNRDKILGIGIFDFLPTPNTCNMTISYSIEDGNYSSLATKDIKTATFIRLPVNKKCKFIKFKYTTTTSEYPVFRDMELFFRPLSKGI